MQTDVPTFETAILPPTSAAIAEAGGLIREGKLVAFPTETVYGLGANALDDFAVSAIFAAKERPQFNPLIVHVLDRLESVELIEFNAPARALADAFWPGALTLVLPRREPSPLALLVSAGLDTAAVRSPSHDVARALLEAAGVPIAAPSANRSSRISPTTAQDVADELSRRVSLILDGGQCAIGLESTIVGFDSGKPVILRKGAIPRDELARVIGPVDYAMSSNIQSPGQLQSHYCARAQLRLNAHDVHSGEALLAFGPDVPKGARIVKNLSESENLHEAAANFFAMLRELDRAGAQTIAVMPIPNVGLGEAINDRLQRAAAPRE